MARRSDHTGEELKLLILEAAARIISEAGVEVISARKVAAEVGYTVGTIYQHFQNMDDLVEQTNLQTLIGLYDVCVAVRGDLPVEDRLISLADAFATYAETNKGLWDAVIAYKYGPDHVWSEAYDHQIERLLSLLTDATQHLYHPEQSDLQIEEIRVLWASLFGIFSLATAGRLGEGRTLRGMVERLVTLYVASRKPQ